MILARCPLTCSILSGWTDAHQEELRRLEEAIAGGNPETVKVIVARMGSQEGTEVLTRFQEGFVTTRGARWKTRQMLDHVDMFFAVYDAMEQCLDEEKASASVTKFGTGSTGIDSGSCSG